MMVSLDYSTKLDPDDGSHSVRLFKKPAEPAADLLAQIMHDFS